MNKENKMNNGFFKTYKKELMIAAVALIVGFFAGQIYQARSLEQQIAQNIFGQFEGREKGGWKEEVLEEKKAELKKKERKLEELKIELEAWESRLEKRESRFDEKEKDLLERLNRLSKKERVLESREFNLGGKEMMKHADERNRRLMKQKTMSPSFEKKK